MRALYVVENTTLPNFQQLVDNGLNTVFWCDHYLQFDTNTTISNLENLYSEIEGLNIDMYLDIYPWQTSTQNEQPDPRSSDYLLFMQDKLETVFNELPELKGLLFDDLYIRDNNQYWDELISHCEDVTACPYLRDIINTYSQGISDCLKSIDQNLELSGNIHVNEIPGSNMEQLCDIFDFMIMMVDGNCNWKPSTILEGINKCNIPTVVELPSTVVGTWLNPEYYNSNDLLGYWFRNVLKMGADGYALYAHPSIVDDLSFTKRKMGMIYPGLFTNYIA